MKNKDHIIFVTLCFLFALILNSKAMTRSAEKMPFDSKARNFTLSLLKPIAAASESLKLTIIRQTAEKYERKYLE